MQHPAMDLLLREGPPPMPDFPREAEPGLPLSFLDSLPLPDMPAPGASLTATVTRTPVRIVRAKTGRSELRLLSERSDGRHQQYLLERTVLWPYHTERTPLVSSSKGTPLAESRAQREFDRVVAQTYPDALLSHGKSVSTFAVIL